MIEIQEDEVVLGETYFVVCDDGVLRYLTAKLQGLHNHRNLIKYIFCDESLTEYYRTYSPYKIFKI